MSRKDVMYLFLRALRQWTPYIKRKAYLSSLEVERAGSAVTVTAKWDETRLSPAGEQRIIFTRERVLGSRGSKALQIPHKKICKFADDTVREILEKRKIM